MEDFKIVFGGRVSWRLVQICRADADVMGSGEVLGEVVGFVELALFPVDMELALAHSVTNPIKTHVNGLGAFLLDRVVGNADSGAVVGDDRGGRLRVAQFLETDDLWTCFLAIVIGGTKFSLGGAAEDFLHEDAWDVDGTVAGDRRIMWSWGLARVSGFAAEKMKTGGAGPGLGGTQIAGIALHVEAHVAGNKADGGVWVRGSIVEELSHRLHGLEGFL